MTDTQSHVETMVLNLILPSPVSEKNIRRNVSHYVECFQEYREEMVDFALKKWEELGHIEPLYPEGVSRKTATPDNTYWHNKKVRR